MIILCSKQISFLLPLASVPDDIFNERDPVLIQFETKANS